jgi:hypothetical protein
VKAAETDPVDYIRNSMPRNVSALITSKVDRLTLTQQVCARAIDQSKQCSTHNSFCCLV